MNRMKFLVSAFVAVLGFLTTPLTFAVDAKLYKGTECVSNTPASLNYTSTGSVENTSTTATVYVVCPAVKDSGSIDSAWLQATDQHFTNSVSCTLYSGYRSGSSFAVAGSSTKSTSGTNTNFQTLSYGALSSNSNGTYHFYCSIPAVYSGIRSAVHAYQITEP